jgi:nitroimidazol reductase NimA-like FMN-containing flavoprotein (pyridoxamine 5'-phosphate oxidase superfamily)
MSSRAGGSLYCMDGTIDTRFSDPDAGATSWADTEAALERAELYWITTVRPDGRPHVTPLIGLWHDGAMHFCTGLGEQKARNLSGNPHVALTTGSNAWAEGLDVVVEGTAARITDGAELQRVAEAIEAKYGSFWHFDVADGGFDSPNGVAGVFRVDASKVLAFAKDPHAQTTFRAPSRSR